MKKNNMLAMMLDLCLGKEGESNCFLKDMTMML